MSEATAVEAKEEKKSNRRKYRNDAWTDEQVAARRAELTVEEVPEGWVKLADVATKFREMKIPVSRLVKATGGDRGMEPVLNPAFRIIYVGRTRYLPPEVLTEGVKLMQDPNFAKTPRKPRVKKEKAEGEPKKERKISVRPTPSN